MISAALSRRAQELAGSGTAFVTATVVRAQRPASVRPGSVGLVLEDGTIEGFVGGVCTEHSVRAYALQAMRTGEPVLLRIVPFDELEGADPEAATGAHGAATVQNPCLSGGAVEVFLEPVLPAPRLLVVGGSPIASAILRLGPELGFSVAAVEGGEVRPGSGDLALVVAAHGRDELESLRAGLEAGLPYVGLVASRKRGDGVLAELRADGVPDGLLSRIDVPAGLDIGARTPSEIALSILAGVVAARRRTADQPPREQPAAAAASPQPAVDPVCGMTVAALPSTPSLTHAGKTVYFCCEGCKRKFEAQNGHAQVAG